MDDGSNCFFNPINQEQPLMQSHNDSKSDHPLYCEGCGSCDFEGDDDGFFYCTTCGSQSQDVILTATAEEDLQANGGIYSFHNTRYQSQQSQTKPILDNLIDQINKINQSPGLNETVNNDVMFDDDEPKDFGCGEVCEDEEKLADGVRVRYVEGLQVMLQRQCEVLVEKFGANAYIIRIVGTIWLRYVASIEVLKDDWPKKVLEESELLAEAKGLARVCEGVEEGLEAQQDAEEVTEDVMEVDVKEVKDENGGATKPKKRKKSKRVKIPKKLEPRNSYGQKSVYIWLRSIRKKLPLYSTLAISFLVCHISRESILPNDICKWASEGKLPYLTEFKDMDRRLGNPSSACPLNSRTMFRPNTVIKAHQLEAIAASIAQRIGLRLPSVNFYAIAQRYLKELCLSTENILPHVCRVYEWALPAELWLSTNVSGFPSRACVMSMLIVAIRLLYNIQDQGIWEMNHTKVSTGPLYEVNAAHCSGSLGSMQRGECTNDDDAKEDHKGKSSEPCNKFIQIQASNYNCQELLAILEASYDKIDSTPDYLKDLASYLEYCKEIVYAGKTVSYEVERLIERLWSMYNKQEDGSTEDVKKCSNDEPAIAPSSSISPGVSAVEKMKDEMEKNGFQYLPPRTRGKNGYIHYKRYNINGKLEHALHLDYYILLRACAKLVEIDPKTMHKCVLSFERRLEWIDKQIEEFFCFQDDSPVDALD